MSSADIFLGLIAILFPPIAVWIKSGLCTCDSLVNILLCCLGYLPGLIHAWWIIVRNPDPSEYEPIPDSEGGRVTYYYISHDGQGRPQHGGGGSAANVPHTARPATPQAPAIEGSSSGDAAPPPSYNDTVRGDHKVQTQT